MIRVIRYAALAGLASVIIVARDAVAQITTAGAASVIIFPKIVADDAWDTVVQIENDANRPAYARCYYVNGALSDPSAPPSPLNQPLWTDTDFQLTLVRQQPTHWVVSRGRTADPNDEVCRIDFRDNANDNFDCDGAGFDPGLVPPVPPGFTGELLCIEVDASGAPWSGNALRGQATLKHAGSGDVVKYPAIGLEGLDANNADGTLCLGGAGPDGCPRGAEYLGCAGRWFVAHPSEFDDRPADGDARSTTLTIVPCGHNFDAQIPRQLTLQFSVTNEFEQTYSASTTVTCWADLPLAAVNDLFNRNFVGTDWLLSSIRSSAATAGGFVVLQQTTHAAAWPALNATTALVAATSSDRVASDEIVIPQEQIP